VPQRFGTHLARGRHVETDGHELVAFVTNSARLFLAVDEIGRWSALVRFAGLALAGVDDLEDPRDLLGVGSDHIALRHRAHVEHFVQVQD